MAKHGTIVGQGEWAAALLAPPAAEDPSAASRARTRLSPWKPVAAVLILGGVGGSIGWYGQSPPDAAPAEVLVKQPAVVGLGYLEPTSTVVRIGATGSTGGMNAKVGTLLVADGDLVKAGQVLAVLDIAPRLAAQVSSSEAQVALKRLQYERQRFDLASTMQSRHAALERAQAELTMAQTEHDRQRALISGNIVSRSSYDRVLRDYLNDRATVGEMQAALRRIEATTTRPDGAASVQIDLAVAIAELGSAEADLAVARASLAEAIIRAPFAGRIISVKAHAGEQIGSDGLLELGDVTHMRAVVEVYQTDVARVTTGQSVELRAEALLAPVRGSVERIGASVQRQTVVNNDPAAATDARVVQVFVVLDARTSRAVAGLSRLQVQAVFLAGARP